MNATLQQIEREFKKEHTLSEKKINILFAFLKAQADRITELEAASKKANAERQRAEAQS
jgi:hypothetical protein